MRLNLGCGKVHLDGYVNVDLRDDADLKLDVRNLEGIADDSVDEILASHIIEHFYIWEVPDMLAEWKRVLKPGGNLYVECPDIHKCAALLLHGEYTQRMTMWGLYGDPNHKNPFMCHKWGYTPVSLVKELSKAGFIKIAFGKAQKVDIRDMRVVCSKPETVSGYA